MGLRSEQLNVETTSYYHLISRCVRRAFLCGKDPYSGQDFEYRREWIEERLFELAQIFGVELHAYAVMSNHLHVVLRVDKERVEKWSDAEVVRRYGKLFRGKPRELEGLSTRERKTRVGAWRERLWNLSWFMRCLNESIARRANAEDECTGRFWEGRFRCQPLLDETALLTCMAYVDLNPLRAGLAKSLKTSTHTSIAKRIAQRDSPAGLAPFADQVPPRSRRGTVPMDLAGYVALLTWTAREVRRSSGRPHDPPDVIRELGLDANGLLETMKAQGLKTASVLGSPTTIDSFIDSTGKAWVRGKRLANALHVGE
ncbi:MAG: transposase [Myxococcota bacterium]